MNPVMHFSLVSLLATSAAFGQADAPSPGWTMWKGGPERTGVASGTKPPPMQLLWRFSTEDNRKRYTSPIVADGRVFFCSQRTLYCLDDETGAELWKAEKGNTFTAPPTHHNGVLYVGNPDRNFYALDAATGRALWHQQTDGGIHCSPLVVEGRVIFGSSDSFVYCVAAVGEPREGEVLWKQRLRQAMVGSPCTDRKYLYVPARDHYVYAMELATGKLKWQSERKIGVNSSPAVVGKLVLVGGGTILYALRAHSGSVQWSAPLAKRGQIANSPVVKDGIIIVGTRDGRLVAFSDTGQHLWESTLEPGLRLESTPTWADECLWIGSSRGFIFGVAPKDGSVLWKYKIHEYMHTEEPAPDEKADPEKPDVPFNVLGSPVVAGGRLYVQGDDGTLYRFGASVLDEYGPELKTTILHVATHDPSRLKWISMDPDENGEEPIVEINGRPPIRMLVKIVDEGSGLNESAFDVVLNGEKRTFEWDSAESLLTIDLAKLPERRGARIEDLKDGQYEIDITTEDWAGNREVHTKFLIVNHTVAIPRFERRETTGGGGGLGGGGGGGFGGGFGGGEF